MVAQHVEALAALHRRVLGERLQMLGHQRAHRLNLPGQLLHQRSDQVNERFDAMQKHLDQRFDVVDKRFEALTRRIREGERGLMSNFGFMSDGPRFSA